MGAAGARTFLLGVKWIASEQTYNFVIYSRHGEQMTHVRVSASRWTRARCQAAGRRGLQCRCVILQIEK